MKRKHLRALTGVMLAAVLALTPAGSAVVPVFGAEAKEEVSENMAASDLNEGAENAGDTIKNEASKNETEKPERVGEEEEASGKLMAGKTLLTEETEEAVGRVNTANKNLNPEDVQYYDIYEIDTQSGVGAYENGLKYKSNEPSVSSRVNSSINFTILYSESDTENLLFDENGMISANAVLPEGWISVNCRCVYYKKNDWKAEGSYTLNGKGVVSACGLRGGLNPDTEYQLYFVLQDSNGDFHRKSDKYTFKTKEGIENSSVGADGELKQGEGYQRKVTGIINSNGERILGYYAGDLGEGGAVTALNPDHFTDRFTDYLDGDEEYQDIILNGYPKSIPALYAIVRAGKAPQNGHYLKAVKLCGNIEFNDDKSLESDASISFNNTDGGLNAKVVIRDPATDYRDIKVKAAIKEHDSDKWYFRYYENDENEGYAGSGFGFRWDRDEKEARDTFIFKPGQIYTADGNNWEESGVESEEKLTIEEGKSYDVRLSLGFYTYDELGERKAFNELKSGEITSAEIRDSFVSASEFSTYMLYVIAKLVYGEDNYWAAWNDIESGEFKGFYQSELNRIAVLNNIVNNMSYAPDLKGIKYLKNLSSLNLDYASYTGLDQQNIVSELEELNDLESLSIREGHIEEMPDLSGLTGLKSLDLEWNRIPAEQITKEKLPETLRNDEKFLSDLKSHQHYASDFKTDTVYYKKGDNYPFSLEVEAGKLAPIKNQWITYEDEFGYENSYYNLERYHYTLYVKVGDKLSQYSVVIPDNYESLSEEEKKEILESCCVDSVQSPDERIVFEVGNVDGITGPGEYDITYELHFFDGMNTTDIDGDLTGNWLIWSETLKGVRFAIPGQDKVTGVKLNETAIKLSVHNAKQLIASVEPAGASNNGFLWSSDNTKVATVDEKGNVKGISPGTAVITAAAAADPSKKATCTVTVEEVMPERLVIKGKNGRDTLFIGETLELVASFVPSDASADKSSVTYESSNDRIASVSGNIAKGIKEGSAVISAEYTVSGGKVLKSQLNVTVRRAEDAKKTFHTVTFISENGIVLETRQVLEGQPVIEPEDEPVKEGAYFTGWAYGNSTWDFNTPVMQDLKLSASFKNKMVDVKANSGSGMDSQADVISSNTGEYTVYLVKGQSYTAGGKNWQASPDSKVATVAKNTGKITAKGRGNVKLSNGSLTCNVIVAEPVLVKKADASSTVIKKDIIYVGNSIELGISGIDPANAEHYPITWYSTNIKSAVINDGLVTGIAKGSSKISAYVGGKAYSATITVSDTLKAPSKLSGSPSEEIILNALQTISLTFDPKKTSFNAKNAVWESVDSSDQMTVSQKGNTKIYRNSFVEITSAGKMTGVGEGKTKISGTDTKGNKVELTVNVVIITTKKAEYLNVSKSGTIKFPKVKPADGIWTSSNEDIIKVFRKANGKATGRVTAGNKTGYSDVSCSYNGFVFETKVYSENPALGKDSEGRIVLDSSKLKGTLKLNPGETYVLHTEGIFQNVSWKSSKATCAFVDENGVIYARNGGTANISAKVNGKTLKIAVTVSK